MIFPEGNGARSAGGKVCIVSSCGGHLTEVRMLQPAYADRDHFYVLNERVELPDDMKGRTHFIAHMRRDLVFFVNLWEAARILHKERPTVILSTGAGHVVPFALVGKVLGIKCVFVESFTRIQTPSLTGRIMYRLADHFYYQWPQLGRYFPLGRYEGSLI